jgi:PAS domain-containing protein
MNDQLDRLNILHSYQILDSGREEAFDNLTRIASKICNTNVSLISILDKDRQWFKSELGLGLGSTSLCHSLCNQLVINTAEFLYIPDLKSDDRFQNHPAFTELGIAFYAGFPIKTREGVVLGSFCVLDYTPKKLDSLQLDFLSAMADQCMQLIEAHKQKHLMNQKYFDLKVKTEIINKATEISKLGGWHLNLETKYVFWVEGTNKAFGLPIGFYPTFQDLLDPQTSPVIKENQACSQILHYISQHFHHENHALTKDFDFGCGKSYQLIIKKDGSDVYHVISDQTHNRSVQRELKKSQNLLEVVEAISSVGGWEIVPKSDEVYWTSNTYEIFELPPDTPLSLNLLQKFYEGESHTQMRKSFTNAISTGESYTAERLITTAKNNKKWVKVIVKPILENGECVRVFGSFQDISHEVKVRQELKERKTEALSKANYFKSLIDNQSFFIIKTDIEGNFTFINEYFKEKFGFEEDSNPIINSNVFELICKEELKAAGILAKRILRNSGKSEKIILKFDNNKKQALTIQWDIKAILNAEGQVVEVL